MNLKVESVPLDDGSKLVVAGDVRGMVPDGWSYRTSWTGSRVELWVWPPDGSRETAILASWSEGTHADGLEGAYHAYLEKLCAELLDLPSWRILARRKKQREIANHLRLSQDGDGRELMKL